MEIIEFGINDEIVIKDKIVACIGYFDGLHKGHQALAQKAKSEALKRKAKSALITFYPDPKDVITSSYHHHIQSFKDRIRIIEAMGIDLLIIMAFDKEMCQMPKDLFFEKILLKLNLSALVCGFDYHYGYKGEGDHKSLVKSAIGHFDVYVIDSINYSNEKISSTRVKKAIEDGAVDLARELLGYAYFIRGEVVHGKKIGHDLGFPTINLKVDKEIILPKEGVYLGYVKYDDHYYKSMINIGKNPTISPDNSETIEAHLLDFEKKIYGEEVIVYFKEYLRSDKRFTSLDELKKQLSEDKKAALRLADDERFIL